MASGREGLYTAAAIVTMVTAAVGVMRWVSKKSPRTPSTPGPPQAPSTPQAPRKWAWVALVIAVVGLGFLAVAVDAYIKFADTHLEEYKRVLWWLGGGTGVGFLAVAWVWWRRC